jgi:peptidoglycan biosynthesis protein MviN/MurJ (putative lipid II flippase)
MKTPAKISIFCICLNIVMSAVLMFPMRQGGITLATVISSVLNNAILLLILRKQEGRMPLKGTIKFALIILIFSLISGAAAKFIFEWFKSSGWNELLPRNLISLFGAGGCFVILFAGLSLIFRIHELKTLIKQIRMKLLRK